MGYQIYRVGYRWGGYGVPAICEQPECDAEIDRGMSYACGGESFSGHGCDRYFCERHRFDHNFNTGDGYRESVVVCARCKKRKTPFPYKPETKEWIEHLLHDESWKEWREENLEQVEKLKSSLITKKDV